MPSCPYCGADNPQGAPFCSLCLARLLPGGSPPTAQPAEPRVDGPLIGPHNFPKGYVSPGDFRAVSGEMAAPRVRRVAVAERARGKRNRSSGQVIYMVFKHSFIVFMVLVVAGFCLGFFLAGALFSSGRSGYYVTLGVVYAVEAVLLIWGGYRISAEALERERGWLYGTVCVAAVIFFWQPLISFLLGLLITEKVVVPQTFSPLGILVGIFMFLPLGALGGWLAEKRYIG